jgi:hypothetical protein
MPRRDGLDKRIRQQQGDHEQAGQRPIASAAASA